MGDDPQRDDDVRRLIDQWHGWAAGLRQLAHRLRLGGHEFDANLKLVRAQVRDQAAQLLHDLDPADAVEEMMRNVVLSSVRTPPLIGYDDAALRYTRARTWQDCALSLNPELAEVQARWD